MVYSGQNLYQWHVSRNIFPNERLSKEQTMPVADFHFHNEKWILINRRLSKMKDLNEDTEIRIGDFVELTEGKKIQLSDEEGGRMILVQLITN